MGTLTSKLNKFEEPFSQALRQEGLKLADDQLIFTIKKYGFNWTYILVNGILEQGGQPEEYGVCLKWSDDNDEISTKVMGCEAAPVVQLKDKDSRTHEYLKRVWQCLEKHHWLNSNAMQFFKDAGYWHGEQLSLF